MIKKIVFIIFSSVVGFQIQSQDLTTTQLDSIFNLFVLMRTGEQVGEKSVTVSHQQRKCGLSLATSVKIYFDRFNTEQQRILKNLIQRPITDTSIVLPSGFFRIHFNKTGISAPLYPIEEILRSADSVYNYEVKYLGYPPPPADFGMGGDNKFDIYIIDLGGNYYGYTQPENHLGNNRYTSFTVIDNDYQGYPTSGINGAKVTLAHEFHHAIQIGNYILRPSDFFYYEITSTAMEEFVYDDINDYYNYLPDYFDNPSVPLILNNGYNLSIWNIFLQKQFDHQLLKRIWELKKTNKALVANAIALNERGASFNDQFLKFGIWNYFTGYRKFPGKYYQEAENYPLIKTTPPISFTQPSRTFNLSSRATTNNYLKIYSQSDTLIVIISNSDIASGIDSTDKLFNITYTLHKDTSRGKRKLAGIFSADFDSPNPHYFNLSEVLNDIVISGDSAFYPTLNNKEIFVYPNPFEMHKNYSLGKVLNIQLRNINRNEVDLYVYSAAMQLIYNGNHRIVFLPNGAKGIRWEINSADTINLKSGIYLLVIKSGDKVLKEKIVIFNE